MRYLLVLLPVFLVVSPAVGQCSELFKPECSVPFDDIAVEREIDRACGPAGSASSDPGMQQNKLKNNFCAKGVPIDLTVLDFEKLQVTTDALRMSHGRRGLPLDRIPLAMTLKIGREWYGEGSVVRFSGYIDSARYANVREGENVNCELEGAANNDIHIELAERRRAGKRARVWAEVSPHFRPEEWTVDRLRLAQDEGRPIRVIGQLFFDASHDPSAKDYRTSTWEVHPVYEIAVCRDTKLSRCRRDANLWVPLDVWQAEAWKR